MDGWKPSLKDLSGISVKTNNMKDLEDYANLGQYLFNFYMRQHQINSFIVQFLQQILLVSFGKLYVINHFSLSLTLLSSMMSYLKGFSIWIMYVVSKCDLDYIFT